MHLPNIFAIRKFNQSELALYGSEGPMSREIEHYRALCPFMEILPTETLNHIVASTHYLGDCPFLNFLVYRVEMFRYCV